MRTVSIGTYIR